MSITVARRRKARGYPKIDTDGTSTLASVRWMNRVSSLFVFCAAIACLGCGADEGGSDADSEDGRGGSGAAGNGGSSGSGVGGSGGTSGGSAGAGAAGSGGGGNQEPLVPLITGHRSTFRFVALDASLPMLETCDDPFAEVGEMDTIEAITGVRYLSFCTDTEVLLEGSGDTLTAHIIDPTGTSLGAAVEYIHSPVEVGESWQTSTTSYIWAEATKPLTVPGGSFDDCWDRVAPPAITTFTYCRGVGLVVGVSLSGNWRIELVSKNF